MSEASSVSIGPLSARFEGMPGTMQGGYVAALAAGNRNGPIRVRIRRPLLAGDELMRTTTGDRWEIHRGDELVMVGVPDSMLVNDPGPPDHALAVVATEGELPFAPPFPDCVGCGGRPDGLGVRLRPLGDGRHMVSVWTPGTETDERGLVPRSNVWTMIDCLTSWSVFVDPPTNGEGGAVTGNIAMQFIEDLQPGVSYLCQSWRERDDERSIICGGTIHHADTGRLVALADQEMIRTPGWGMEVPVTPLC